MEKLGTVIVTLVLKLKGIVILMMSVRIALVVDQTTVLLHLVLPLKLIAVINQLLEMNTFVHQEFLVEKMKEIVIQMMSVRLVLLVACHTTAQLHLVLNLKLIVVFHALIPVVFLKIKVITIVMLKITIVDVNGMEETVVEIILTSLIVQIVNV